MADGEVAVAPAATPVSPLSPRGQQARGQQARTWISAQGKRLAASMRPTLSRAQKGRRASELGMMEARDPAEQEPRLSKTSEAAPNLHVPTSGSVHLGTPALGDSMGDSELDD